MINFPLTIEVMNLAKMLVYQARLPICNCDCPCNCLEIHAVKVDIDNLIIETKNKSYRLQAIWVNERNNQN